VRATTLEVQSQRRQWYGLPRGFWYLWLGTLINRLGGFVSTFLAIYLTERRGYAVESAGLVVALYGAGSLCAGPLGGILADRMGRRKTLLIALLGSSAAMVNLGLARAYPHIAVGALLLGCLGDLGRPASNAAIADLVPPSERPRAYALLYWAINLGFAGSAILAGMLAKYDFLLLFLGDALTTAVFGLIVILRVPETRPSAAAAVEDAGQGGAPVGRSVGLLAPYRDPVFLTVVLIQFAVAWCFCQSISSLPLDMSSHGIPMPRYGQLIALNGIFIVLLQPMVVRVIARTRRSHALALGALLTGVGFGLCALGHSQVLYAVSIIVWTLGEITLSPVVPTLIADLAPRELRGSYQGAYQLAWGGAALLGPSLGGLIMGHFGAHTLWLICIVLGVGAAWLHLIAAPARRERFRLMPDGEGALAREDPR